MPELPSGLTLALSRHALIDHGGNWFHCPEGHFWYWAPAPEVGPPPYELGTEISTSPNHALVPKDREEVQRFIMVLEMTDDGVYGWSGELLATFPQYTDLDDQDLEAWKSWLNKPETDAFLDETIEGCQRLAEDSQKSAGLAKFTTPKSTRPDPDGLISAELKKPGKPN